MKILYVSDDIRLPTGYGNLGKSFCKYLKKNHEIVVLAGSQQPGPPTEIDGIKIFPVHGYGTSDSIRYFVKEQKPDIVLLNADPRFFQDGAFLIDNEIRKRCPLVLYHLWDDEPFPTFNVPFYRSCDSLIIGSQFTHDLLSMNAEQYSLPPLYYAPIGIDTEVYKPLPMSDRQKMLDDILKTVRQHSTFGVDFTPTFIAGFIGRFGHRKRLIDLMRMFTKFAKGKKDVMLLLHTNAQDESGQIGYVVDQLFRNSPIVLSFTQAQPAEAVNRLYNVFDVTLNISHAEGFGMPLIESMSTGTPCISAATAGPSGFITDQNGWLLPPAVITTVGSPTVPFINDRFVSDSAVINALEEAYKNRTLLQERASRCRETIMKQHTEKQMVQVIEKALIETKANWKPYLDYTFTSFPARVGE